MLLAHDVDNALLAAQLSRVLCGILPLRPSSVGGYSSCSVCVPFRSRANIDGVVQC